MAITQLGSTIVHTASGNISVPAGTQLILVEAGYLPTGVAHVFSAITLNGVALDAAATLIGSSEDAAGAVYYQLDPPTGTQALNFTIAGTPDVGPVIFVSFWDGETAGLELIDADIDQEAGGGGEALAIVLTTAVGDLVVGGGFGWINPPNIDDDTSLGTTTQNSYEAELGRWTADAGTTTLNQAAAAAARVLVGASFREAGEPPPYTPPITPITTASMSRI